MESYKRAYLKFLERYKDKEWYEGAILCGSYATGNYDENSDLDIYIVSNDVVEWRERGNCLVDNYMIEYFINPLRKIKEYFNDEKNSFSRHTLAMFNQAIIIQDKNGEVKKLTEIAKKYLMTTPEIAEYKYKMNCYACWELFDELESKFNKGLDIDLSFYTFLQTAISTLSYNKGIGLFNINKIEYFLNNKEYAKKYGITKFFNKKDAGLILECLTEKDREVKFYKAKQLYQHICNEFKFDINNFKFRSKA